MTVRLLRLPRLGRIIVVSLLVLSLTILPPTSSLLTPIPVAAAAQNSCRAEDILGYLHDPNYEPVRIALTGKVGGVKLDQAAEFLADMSDITGAYYDTQRDQIVFIGTTEVAVPKFDRDDLAVAIRSIFFAQANPGVKIEYVAPEDPGVWETSRDMNVNYMPSKEGDIGGDNNPTGTWEDDHGVKQPKTVYGIENTAFTKVLFDADLKLKKYYLGYEQGMGPNREHWEQRVESSVPGYKPHHQRWLEKNPDTGKRRGAIRIWLSPKEIIVKRDEAQNSFVFDHVTMEVKFRDVLGEHDDAKWIEAANEFSAHHTEHFDEFAAETPAYFEVKRLAKIVGVVKWLKDNNIPSDFAWARDHEPEFVATPRKIEMIRVDTGTARIGGGINYFDPNTYVADSGESAGLKQSAQANQPSPADFHWEFASGGQDYEAVAVSAELFRNAGGYSTAVTDIAAESRGELPLALTRTYASQSATAMFGMGRGWDPLPARLHDIGLLAYEPACRPPSTGEPRPYRLSFATQAGHYETFTYSCTTNSFQPDHASYTSRVVAHDDGTYTVMTKELFEYTFDVQHRLTTIRDRSGNRLSYEYGGPLGQLSSIQDDVSHWIGALGYDARGRITGLHDWAGHRITYEYDAQGRLVRTRDEQGRPTTYHYDSQNRLTKIIDPAGQEVTGVAYNELNKVTAQTDALGRTVNLSYDEAGRTITGQDSTGTSNRYVYDADARIVEEVDALGQATRYTYGGTWRAPETVTDKRGNTTRYQYDQRGNVTSVTTPDGRTIVTEYNAANLPTRITDNRYTPSRITNLTYDAKHNVTRHETAGVATQMTYDQFGNVTQETDPLTRTTVYERNNLGLPTAVTDAAGNIARFEYDSAGRVSRQIDSTGVATTYTYDAADNLLTTTDPVGTTRYTYDNLDRLTSVTLPNDTAAQYSYNAAGSITTVTDARGNATTYTYDTRGNLTTRRTAAGTEYRSEFDALSRPIKHITPAGKAQQLAYDPAGNPRQLTDAANQAATQEFDNLNRVTRSSFADQTAINRTYDARGNVLTASDGQGQTSFTYDQFDRLLSATDPFGNIVSYTYDANGNRTQLTYPHQQKVTYVYDPTNRLTSVTDWNNQVTNLTYFPNGLVKEKKLPNGISLRYAYDSANRLNRLSYHNSAGSVIGQSDITRDAVGNITKLNESGPLYTQAVGASPTPSPTPSANPTKPDLIVTDVRLSIPNPRIGQNFDIYATIKNNSSINTSTSTIRVGFYYDRPAAPTITDIYDDYDSIFSGIAANQSKEARESLVDFSTAGQHNIWVYVDQRNAISEGNENNNVFGPFTVDVSAATSRAFGLIPIADAQEPPAQVTTFQYDPLGQLQQAAYPDGQTYQYSYDAIGNRQQQVRGSQTTNYTYDNDAQLNQANSTSYTHDPNGSTTRKQQGEVVSSYTFNPRHQLVRAGSGEVPPETWDLALTKQTDAAWNIDIGNSSAPAIIDLDADGKLDLLIGEAVGNINHYEQTSNAPTAAFVLVTENLGGIDIGSNSAPALGDVDADNDLDLFIGKSDGTIAFYRNTGTTTQPTFTLVAAKFNNFDIGSNSTPHLVDLDADGDLDLFVGASDGTIKWYPNIGTPQTASFALANNTYASIDIGNSSAPVFAKGDSDNDLDLFIGKSDGTIAFYRNTGTTTQPTFTLVAAKYLNIDAGSNSIPIFRDLTGDSLPDLLIGESAGKLKIYNASKQSTSPPDPGTRLHYDALGNRVSKTVAGQELRYVNDLSGELPYVLAEVNSTNQLQSLYLYAGGVTSYGAPASANRLYPLTDPLGNVRFVTNASGALVARYAYDPFGTVTKKEGTVNSAFTFSAEQADAETNLTFLRARYYDPATGRFLSRDPVLGPLGIPHSQNPYAYALSNPVNLNDPSGEIVPLLVVAAYAAFELGITAYDAYNTYQTLTSEGISCLEKAATSAGFVAGLALPGAGYGTVSKGVVKPIVTNKKLQNIVGNLYKGLNSKNQIGTGSTADAIRHTMITGELVGGSDHLIKGQQSVSALNNFLRDFPTASASDRRAAQLLKNDLINALNGK